VFISVAMIFKFILVSSIFISQNNSSKSLYILIQDTIHFFKSKSISFKRFKFFAIFSISSDVFQIAKKAPIIAHKLVQAISFITIPSSSIYFKTHI
jgi:hypothetical protein